MMKNMETMKNRKLRLRAAYDPAYDKAVARLRDRLLKFYMETADYVPPKFDKR